MVSLKSISAVVWKSGGRGQVEIYKGLEKIKSVAIVEDTGGFSEIIVAAHELGHL